MNTLDLEIEESIRSLWANIHFATSDNNLKSITITSTVAGEGKTTLSRNLSVAIAKSGLSVLYIDADTRRIGHSSKKGLADFIHGNASFSDIIVKTKVSRLTYVTAGINRANPSKIMVSPKFTQLLAFAKDKFDYVIFDTPPISYVIDGVVLASKTDATLLVIADGMVDSKEAIKVKKQLDDAKANIIGVAINKSEKKTINYFYDNNSQLMDK